MERLFQALDELDDWLAILVQHLPRFYSSSMLPSSTSTAAAAPALHTARAAPGACP